MVLLVALLFILIGADAAHAQCNPEASPCYRLLHYSYNDGVFCQRYYSNSVRYYGIVGSVAGIGQPQIDQMIFDAYTNWYSNTALRVFVESAGIDTSGTNPRVAVVDDATFTGNWGGPVSGPLAVTFNQVYPDGTIKYNRTYIRGDNSAFVWHQDCFSENCSPTYANYDMPGVLTHELGHWWFLDDVGPPADITACDSVAMWAHAVNSGLFQRALKPWDVSGVDQLYDTPTSVGMSFTASPGPAQDTLRWEESDPSGIHDYNLYVSDACWGPHSFLATVTDGDPAYTPDGRFYTFIAPAPYARPYDYLIFSDDGSSEAASARTDGAAASPPSVPTSLVATAVQDGGAYHVDLNWSPSTGAVSDYYLYRHWLHLTSCAVGKQAAWTVLGPVATSSFTDSLPPTGDSLFYRVRAINSTGGSGLSSEAGVDLSATAGVGGQLATRAGIRVVGPNPASGPVEIAYVLPRGGHTMLGAYDIAGRMVARIVNDVRPSGEYRTRWLASDGSSRSSGMFFLRLSLDEKAIGRERVVILR